MQRVVMVRPDLRCELLDDETAFLFGEQERFMFRDRAAVLALSLIDGSRTIGQLLELAQDRVAPETLFLTVERLLLRGYLVAVPTNGADPAWWTVGLDPVIASANLEQLPVQLQAVGALELAPLADALRAAGVCVAEDAEGSALRVVVCRDYLEPELEQVSRLALEDRTPWCLLKPLGRSIWLGPLFRPGDGPCWSCLAHRLRANRPVEAFLQRRKGLDALPLPPAHVVPGRLQAAGGLAAVVLARWLAKGLQEQQERHLLQLDTASLCTTRHPVVRRPQCPACGDPGQFAAQLDRPVELRSRRGIFNADGGHRLKHPDQTFADLERQISPITGIVSSVGPVPGRNRPPRAVYGSSWFACPGEESPGFESFHRTGLGKGTTASQARASALCEAVERQGAAFQGDEPRRRATARELGEQAVLPRDLLLFSERQVAERGALNQKAHRGQQVPPPLDRDQPIDWSPVWSLTEQRTRLLPSSYLFADLPQPPEERVCPYDSNGDAAGNCLEEAVLQGLLELVERDAVAIWWYNRLLRPGVELASFDDPYLAQVQQHYGEMDWSLWVLDVTSDLQLPTFVAYAEGPDGRFSIGCGCHLEARIAVQRSITELNQLFDPKGEHPLPWAAEDIEDPAFLHPDPTAAPRCKSDYPSADADDLAQEVLACVQRIEQAGLETLVLDRTRPDVGLATVKVVVPGLRHFWPRLGQGRLYQVPVEMGWRAQALEESGLNPVPLLI